MPNKESVHKTVFISWSGKTSRGLAERLHEWLPKVFPNAAPWVSTLDIRAGKRWREEIAGHLEDAAVGIFCLTSESIGSQWVMFEAGAIAWGGNALLIPYLLGLPPDCLHDGPLGSYHAVAADREGTLNLTTSINECLGFPIKKDELNGVFQSEWSAFEEKLAAITVPPKNTGQRPLDELMLQASTSLIISGHTLYQFTQREHINVIHALGTLAARNTKVTFILLHPFSDYCHAHERFHRLETTGLASAREQIEATIRYFGDNAKFLGPAVSVYLSDYKPCFRLIVVDNSDCHVNLYMFGKEVNCTPQILYEGNTQEARVLRDSVDGLVRSRNVVPLLKDGKVNPDWESHAAYHTLPDCLSKRCCVQGPAMPSCDRWNRVRSALLGNQNPNFNVRNPLDTQRSNLVAPRYKPGTFTLGEMTESGRFLGRVRTYGQWLDESIDYEWRNLEQHGDLVRDFRGAAEVRTLKQKVAETLEFRPLNYIPLKDHIWYQEYTDIIRRVFLTHMVGNPDLELNQHPSLTVDGKAAVLSAIRSLARDADLGLRHWLRFSIIAGLLGVNKKPDQAATSIVHNRVGIDVGDPTDIATAMRRLLDNDAGVDDSEQFFSRLPARAAPTFRVLVFSDDYLETLFLLKFYELLLDEYLSLEIDVVPRSIRCGNDATASDLREFLDEFPGLHRLDGARFRIVDSGPKLGGVNMLKLHPEVADLVLQAEFLDVRGARNYEMMQRIGKDAFFGFMVARTTSEIVTGLNVVGDVAPFFYKFQRARTTSFVGPPRKTHT